MDPTLLHAVDAYVAEHDGVDRSKVIDRALAYWTAAQQEAAMEAQFAGVENPPGPEVSSWRSIRRTPARRPAARA